MELSENWTLNEGRVDLGVYRQAISTIVSSEKYFTYLRNEDSNFPGILAGPATWNKIGLSILEIKKHLVQHAVNMAARVAPGLEDSSLFNEVYRKVGPIVSMDKDYYTCGPRRCHHLFRL